MNVEQERAKFEAWLYASEFANAYTPHLWETWKARAQQSAELHSNCTRSHPHELMSPMCELRTEIARLNNQAVHTQARLAEAEKDAERYRWLRDQHETDGIAIVMKNKHIDDTRSYASNINDFIDAALANTKDAA